MPFVYRVLVFRNTIGQSFFALIGQLTAVLLVFSL